MINFDRIVMIYQLWAKVNKRSLVASVFNIPGSKRWTIILVHDKKAK